MRRQERSCSSNVSSVAASTSALSSGADGDTAIARTSGRSYPTRGAAVVLGEVFEVIEELVGDVAASLGGIGLARCVAHGLEHLQQARVDDDVRTTPRCRQGQVEQIAHLAAGTDGRGQFGRVGVTVV